MLQPAVVLSGILLPAGATLARQIISDPAPGRHAPCAQPDVLVRAFERDNPELPIQHRADADLAVGECHVVAITNFGVKAFTKSGELGSLSHRLSQDPMAATGAPIFWRPLPSPPHVAPFLSRAIDPQVIYDGSAGRFFASALLVEAEVPVLPLFPDRLHFALAVTRDADPNPAVGDPAWWTYRVEMTTVVPSPPRAYKIDQPTLALDSDRVYLLGNSPNNYWHIAIVDKAPLLTGAAPAVIDPQWVLQITDTWAKLATRFGPDDGSAQYLINDGFAGYGAMSATSVRIYAVTRQTPPSIEGISIPVPFYRSHHSAPQAGNGSPIRTDVGAFYTAPVYRNGSLWAVHTVRHTAGDDRARVRWYQVLMKGWPDSGNDPELVQWGELAVPAPLAAYYPSIAVDCLDNAAITFNVSGPDKPISMWQAVRCHSDPPNTFREPYEVVAGRAVYKDTESLNWGDFSGTDPDPVAPSVFWAHAQVPHGSGGITETWTTWISRTSSACSLDLDGDGTVSSADFAAYMSAYLLGQPKADYRADGVIDSRDVLALHDDLYGP